MLQISAQTILGILTCIVRILSQPGHSTAVLKFYNLANIYRCCTLSSENKTACISRLICIFAVLIHCMVMADFLVTVSYITAWTNLSHEQDQVNSNYVSKLANPCIKLAE